MNIDTLQTFISDNVHANVPDSVVGEMMKDAENMDFGSFVDKWDETLKANSAGWSDMRGTAKSLPERFTAAFGTSDSKNPFVQDANFKDELYEKSFKDVPKEQFDATVDNMSKYWEDEKRAREYTAGKKLREKEVKDWPMWKNILASDYAKQRYINEPEKSIFSDEGEWYNKGEDISDLAYGVAGAAGDVLPGYGLLVGPAARAARDVHHKAIDSPYQKEWSDIAQDVATDALVNASVDFLPNLRRYTNMGKRGSKESPISTVMDLEDDINSVRTQLKNLSKAYDSNSNIELIETINKLPEGDLKNELLKYTTDYKNIDKAGIVKVANEWHSKLNAYDTAPFIDVAKNVIEGKAQHHGSGQIFDDALFKRKLLEPNLSKGQKLAKNIIRGVEVAAEKGGPALKEIDTAKGRGSEPAVNDKLVKDWYKQNYERDWKMGFKPNEKEGDLLWEAYKEWKEGK